MQFGTGERRIVLDHITAADARWLTSLDGLHTWAEITKETLTNAQRRLMDAALRTGAIEDAGRVADSWRVIPADQRTRQEADFAASRLTYRGIDQTLAAIERRLTLRIHVVGTGPLFDACVALAEASCVSMTQAHADIVLIAGGCHPDALFAHAALSDPAISVRPHVVVAAHGDFGTVGPLVIPGETSCLMCHQHHHRDGDPAWPVLVTQRMALAERLATWPIDRIHAHALASQTFLLVRTWREQPTATHLWANRARRIWLPDGTLDELPRPIHPRCGCTWSPVSEGVDDT